MSARTKISLSLLAALVTVLLLVRFVVRPSVVVGASMEPTLKSWDYCISLRVRHYEPRRGDIVTFRTADEPPLYMIKRVIGLPGETVEIDRGVLRINGQPLAEPYTTMNASWQMEPMLVPTNKMFVLGDNRRHEPEDYVHGLVSTRLVVARLLWRWRWKK